MTALRASPPGRLKSKRAKQSSRLPTTTCHPHSQALKRARDRHSRTHDHHSGEGRRFSGRNVHPEGSGKRGPHQILGSTTHRGRFAMVSLEGEGWWSWGDSNPRPHHCERCALPTELQPQTRSFNATMLEGLRCVRMVWGGYWASLVSGSGDASAVAVASSAIAVKVAITSSEIAVMVARAASLTAVAVAMACCAVIPPMRVTSK